VKDFCCVCGNRVFFENTHCMRCGRLLGYDPEARAMLPLEWAAQGILRSPAATARDRDYRLCRNTTDYQACNWLLDADAGQGYCRACRLNRTIPNLQAPENLRRWQALETAKRRLVYSLLELKLPVVSKLDDAERGFAFEFLEDKTSNPQVVNNHVTTGHRQGLITLNVIEADDAAREQTRSRMNEPYRTLLGHFRHEIGHYYWDRLVSDSSWLEPYRQRFGDERVDYAQAMQTFYRSGPPADWREAYISAYACAHPWEDWAETWAHYLHMTDTLETALFFGVVAREGEEGDFDLWLAEWMKLTVVMNALNRSMGQQDAYPFVLSPTVTDKLRFVHRVVTLPPNAS
jgi:hypothetical protein